MQTECDKTRRRRPSFFSIPVNPRQIPLLAHEHPPLKFARPHHQEVPHHGDGEYKHYRAMRDVALCNGIKNLEHELWERSPVERMILENDTLIIHYHSQSKLSQQELADLQKATHFDKKELQQWYKGMHVHGST
jgi:neuronal calcium sensor 1